MQKFKQQFFLLRLRLLAVGIFALLLVAVLLLTELPQALVLSEPAVFATNIPNNQIITSPNQIKNITIQRSIPLPIGNAAPVPQVSAAAVLIEDLDSGMVIYAKDPDKKVAIASTTKIMTAIVALNYYHSDDILTVYDLSGVSGSSMGLKVGEKISFRNLLYGLLLPSGNDAAFTLAENYPGGKEAFIQAMNEKAASLGLINTHFDNPAGFDSPSHYSSAADLAKIAQVAILNNQFAQVVATKVATVSSSDSTTVHQLENVNKLLGQPGVMGIKTGYTPAAKENLVGLFERNGHRILTIILGSDDRFGETEKLVNWTYSNFIWQQ